MNRGFASLTFLCISPWSMVYPNWMNLCCGVSDPWHSKESFARLATMCFHKGWKLYKYRPKYHLVCHIVRGLQKGDRATINPLCFLIALNSSFNVFWIFEPIGYICFKHAAYSFEVWKLIHAGFNLGFGCWQDEDHIGQTSRISRSCHPLLASTRTIQKVLGLYMRQLEKIH